MQARLVLAPGISPYKYKCTLNVHRTAIAAERDMSPTEKYFGRVRWTCWARTKLNGYGLSAQLPPISCFQYLLITIAKVLEEPNFIDSQKFLENEQNLDNRKAQKLKLWEEIDGICVQKYGWVYLLTRRACLLLTSFFLSGCPVIFELFDHIAFWHGMTIS
jgi:hypothetical protein